VAPKNIAVFADGTGNSSAKLFKTNVWRLYQALDATQPTPPGQTEQISYYDNGVGTSSFRPLAIFGGAFGWGLKRNVLDCYKFVCRNYAPGDRIYLLGFSRGAFTARVLAGLICREGLVQPTDAALDRYARDAYRAYRRRFHTTARLSRRLVDGCRALREGLINFRRTRGGHPVYTPAKNIRPEEHAPDGRAIAFIGVWDTVAAYGMPIAEMTRAIDKYIWPLSMPDQRLHPTVGAARHALALDDERDTFHPVLWDEITSVEPGRIKQVWFAGMHSDVGGGYPEDTLSYIPLAWMLSESQAAGLRFAPCAVAEIQRFSASIGPLHDSRHGLAGYYRYQPRKISARVDPPDATTRLMQDPKHATGMLASVNIHESVLRRIATGSDDYAPIVLNGAYRIEGPPPPYSETQAEAAARALAQERVWDRVWLRRVNYFAALAVSAGLALFPLLQAICHTAPCTGPLCLLAPIISGAGEFLPGFAQPWINAYAATPGWTLVFVALLTWLLLRSGNLEQLLRTDMRALWEASLQLPHRRTTAPSPPPAWIRWLRTAPRYQLGFQAFKWRTLPGAFGIIFWLFIIVPGLAGLGAVGFRFSLWLSEAGSEACPADPGGHFTTATTCQSFGKRVEAGQQYRVNVTITKPWADKSISTSPEGFGPSRMPFPINLLALLKRAPSARWFQPLVKIVGPTFAGLRTYRVVPLEMRLIDPAHGVYTAEFTAPIGGEAQFFVNDLLLPRMFGGAAEYYYENNQGAAMVDLVCASTDKCLLRPLP
jgi:uncharacterized protein (DUF2235 family)